MEPKLLEVLIMFPREEFRGFESVGQLLVRHQCLVRLIGSGANQWNSQIVGKKTNGVQVTLCSRNAPARIESISSMTSIRTSICRAN